MNLDLKDSYISGVCLCRHDADEHARGYGACEHFASGEMAGRDGCGELHCRRFVDRSDADQFRQVMWRELFSSKFERVVLPERALRRLREALAATRDGGLREAHRLQLRAVERQQRLLAA